MSSKLSGEMRANSKFSLKQSIEDFKPVNLKNIADKLQKSQSGLIVRSSSTEVSKLINEFLVDVKENSENELHTKWIRKKKDLLDILIVVGRKNASNDLSLADIEEILEKSTHILLSQKRIQARYIESIGRATLNNMGNQRLKRMFFAKLEQDNQALGKRATIWKKEIASLNSPDIYVKTNLAHRKSLKDIWGSIAADSTWFGSNVVRESLHQIGSNNLQNFYRKQLIGDYSATTSNPENLGILAELDIEELSAFVNSYCYNLKGIPSKDIFLDYFVLAKTMDVPSAGVKWNHPLIHEMSRKKVDSYLLQSDFRNAFDHILMHPERKQYWIKWLESGYIKRIRVFGNMNRIQKYKFNCPVASMEFPTLQMDLGPCYAFECGKQGSGALYVYPSNKGPLDWNIKIQRTREYKQFIRYKVNKPANWLSISHFTNWQQNVDTQLLRYYRLKR